MVRSKWKAPFVDYQLLDSIIGNKTRSVIRTKSRSSTILQSFIGLVIAVYTGRMYNNVYIDEKMVGHKLGEFYKEVRSNSWKKRQKREINKKIIYGSFNKSDYKPVINKYILKFNMIFS